MKFSAEFIDNVALAFREANRLYAENDELKGALALSKSRELPPGCVAVCTKCSVAFKWTAEGCLYHTDCPIRTAQQEKP